MRARHVLGDRCVPMPRMRTGMARHADALVQDLDRGVGDAGLDLLADEARRHRVIVIGDLDVIVGRDPALLPLGILIGRRSEAALSAGRSISANSSSRLTPSLRMILALRSATISRIAALSSIKREEAPVAQPRQHEALDDLHADFDLGLVARLARTRRQDRGVVVLGQLLVGAIDAGLIAAGRGDAGLEVVAHDRLRHAADRGQGVDVRADPVGSPSDQRASA